MGFLCPLKRPAWCILAWMRALFALCPPALPQLTSQGGSRSQQSNSALVIGLQNVPQHSISG
eukprot:1154845-Pelagomonas_calceolata.AAC.1